MGVLLVWFFFWYLVKVLNITGVNDKSSAQRIISNNEVNKNSAVDQILSTVNVNFFSVQFGLN